ncbi:MAG: hypothetical protein Ct9H300mP7_2980 [Verrucomicrobiota bacterium]|nr:MAG: hypothetical protein Ct9H300mP7_2980 [Verrucomicrobiota bacterium]
MKFSGQHVAGFSCHLVKRLCAGLAADIVPGDAEAKRPVGTGWYRCWVKVPDNWTSWWPRSLG